MITKVKLTLKTPEKSNFNWGSVLQGVIMEKITPAYAEFLHSYNFRPYSQYIIQNENPEWYITTLNQQAADEIFSIIMNDNFNSFDMEHHGFKAEILNKEIAEQKSYNDFIKEFYLDTEPSKFVKMNFITPVSFKHNGEYMIFPEISLIFRSLMKKYDTAVENNALFSENVLEDLCKAVKITSYRLKSVRFDLEGVKIPSFMGTLTIGIKGNQTITSLINMILNYAKYSGLGIKTALGMGACNMEGDNYAAAPRIR